MDSINYKNVLCIGPSGTSGRAIACKSFIYNLLLDKISVAWKPIKIDNTGEESSELDKKVSRVKNALLKYSEVVLCSHPKDWNSLIESNKISSVKNIIAKLFSDIDEVNEEIIELINNSKIDILSVINEETFNKLNGKINKEIIIEKLTYVVDKRNVEYKAFDNEELFLDEGWYNIEIFDNKMFRWTKPSFSFVFNKEIPYTKMRLELVNEFNDKEILILARLKNGLTKEIHNQKYTVDEKISISIDIKDVQVLKFSSQDCSSFGNDTRNLFLKFYDVIFENENSIDTIPIGELKTEQEARNVNFLFSTNNEIITEVDTLYSHKGKRTIKEFNISKGLKTAIILYLQNLSPKNLKCLNNLTSYKASNRGVRIITCSEVDLEIPNKYPVEFYKFEMPPLTFNNVWAKERYAFWSFIEFIRIADNFELDHFFGYEWDCKVGQDLWFDKLWDEFLSWDSEPIIAGTPAIRYNASTCGNLLQSFAEYSYNYSKECGLTISLEPAAPYGLYCNGALTFYNTAKMKEYFAKELAYRIGDDTSILESKYAWDLDVGLRILKDVKEKVFNKVAWTPSSYSGFGDFYYNQRQRNKMLETGLKAVIHQYKY